MAKKVSREKIRYGLKHDEFVETAFDIGTWVEENWKKVAIGAAAIVVVGLAVMALLSWRSHRLGEAVRLFGEGFMIYDEASRGSALDALGLETDKSAKYDEALAKFDEAQEIAGSTPLGDAAEMYRGIVLLKSGNATEAVPILESITEGGVEPVLAGTARANLAEAYAATGRTDEAIEQWKQLADDPEGYFPADIALLNAGTMLEAQGRADESRQALRDLIERFPGSQAAATAREKLGEAP
jgi:tetratricopeptide (TPR) repeat protein